MKISKWEEKRVIVTGGASFIGSHLVDKLVNVGADVTVIDDLSSGKLSNLQESENKFKFFKKDLEYIEKQDLRKVFQENEIVFHLAAVHGGRGYIQTHPADVCSNLSIDHHVFEACANTNIESIAFASTACVYPLNLQKNIGSDYKLKESDSDPSNLDGYMSADIEYGWSKLMGEIQLNSFINQYGIKGVPVRFVTAYGPRENETHSIIALIYKALEKMDPYKIWGNGKQERDFTFVHDIVEGIILASEKIKDGTPINLGTGRMFSILETVNMICDILNWKPSKFEFELEKPVGALSRSLDNSRAKELIGWTPRFSLKEGLAQTISWYTKTHKLTGRVDNEILFQRVES